MSSALIRFVTTWLSVPPLCNIFLRKLRQFTLGSTGLKAFLFLMQMMSEAARGEENKTALFLERLMMDAVMMMAR